MAGFADQVRQATGMTRKAVNRVVASSIGELTFRIVDRTPVLTGLLKGNWQASLGAPIDETIERLDKGGQETVIAAGQIAEKAAAQVFYLRNNLDYAYKIEAGGETGSPKAPHGMLQISVVEWPDILKKAVKQNKV